VVARRRPRVVVVVIASRLDPRARELVAHWSSAKAALLSAEDLCSAGWTFSLSDPAAGTAVVAGRRVRVAEIRGVVTRRPAVLAEELDRIEAEDREYVAAEINAFLVAWLTALPCRVFNRPTPRSLTGPGWTRLHWAAAAARAGVPWGAAADGHDVIVCGTTCVGARSSAESDRALALARAAAVDLLGVRIAEGNIRAATTQPSLDDEAVRSLVLARLLGP